jgi:galactose mutarotase-like enzyme
MQTLENSKLKIQVKEVGAELSSIFNIETGKELMWQGNPDVWSGQAPVLFPVIGCLKEGHFIYKGEKYACPKHGFIRNNNSLTIEHKDETSVVFKIESNPDLKKIYPFDFKFFITYTLIESTITVHHKLINNDDKTLYFQIGGHTAFSCPVNDDEKYDDYYLEFDEVEHAETFLTSKEGLIYNYKKPFILNTDKIQLHNDIFIDDAIMFKGLKSQNVSLITKKNSNRIKFDFSEFPLIAFWAKPNSSFVCIEPWLGIADFEDCSKKIEEKKEINILEAQKKFEISYKISVE